MRAVACLLVVLGVAARAQAADTRLKGNRVAIVIGVDSYTKEPKLRTLRGAGNDAKNFRDALVAVGRFAEQDVVLLTDKAKPVTRADILTALAETTKKATGKLLVFFFAGHGKGVGKDAYLMPSAVEGVGDPSSKAFKDSAIAVDEVRALIEASQPQDVVLLLDACRYTGSAVERGVELDDVLSKEFYARSTFANRTTVFATAPGSAALETDEATSTGFFTATLIDMLRGNVPGVITKGEVAVGTLSSYLSDEVERRVQVRHPRLTQRPQFASVTSGTTALSFPADPIDVPLRLPEIARTSPALRAFRGNADITKSVARKDLQLQPGSYDLSIDLPAYETWRQTVAVTRDGRPIDVILEPKAYRTWGPLVVGAVGLVALAGGGVVALLNDRAEESLEARCRAGCSWDEQAAGDRHNENLQHLQTALLGTGAMGVAVGAAGWLWWRLPILTPENHGGGSSRFAGSGLGIAGQF